MNRYILFFQAQRYDKQPQNKAALSVTAVGHAFAVNYEFCYRNKCTSSLSHNSDIILHCRALLFWQSMFLTFRKILKITWHTFTFGIMLKGLDFKSFSYIPY